ncbi:MAG: fumarate hydratase [Anaerovoracaceae bacterium]
MRTINTSKITSAIAELAMSTNYGLTDDVTGRIEECRRAESDPRAKEILEKIQKNIEIAGEESVPLCQDTGLACVFLDIGQEVYLEGEDLYTAVNEGVRRGYQEGFLRKSVVGDPLRRKNTGDNTPASIHVEIVPGDQVKITMAPKGFGSENMSQIKMFPPSAGEEGFKDFVVDVVRQAGGNPCPPIVVGVGIGGTFDKVAYMAKRALTLPLDHRNSDPYYAGIEDELLERINQLDIGPQGFGGRTTALAVNIIQAPTHIAGMPVAVNINCHVSRHGVVII